MTPDDYKTLLAQAEEETSRTPGAYCSRRAAIRAIELLRETRQVEFNELEKKHVERLRLEKVQRQDLEQTIERQAQAIKRLEEEKTKGVRLGASIGSGIDSKPELRWKDDENGFRKPQYVAGIDPFNENAKPQIIRRSANNDDSPFRRALNDRLDEDSL